MMMMIERSLPLWACEPLSHRVDGEDNGTMGTKWQGRRTKNHEREVKGRERGTKGQERGTKWWERKTKQERGTKGQERETKQGDDDEGMTPPTPSPIEQLLMGWMASGMQMTQQAGPAPASDDNTHRDEATHHCCEPLLTGWMGVVLMPRG